MLFKVVKIKDRVLGGCRRIVAVCLGMISSGVLAVTNVSLVWDPSPDASVVGYAIHVGGSRGDYTNRIEVGNITNTTVSGLSEFGTYFFVATAYAADGTESLPSNEVSVFPTAVPPVELPLVNITSHPNAGTTSTLDASANLSGTATTSDSIVQVTWSNACNQANGNASGTTSWNVSNVPLCVGNNQITIMARDSKGNVGSSLTTIIRTVVDCTSQIAPANVSLPPEGGSFCVNVAIGPTCVWIASGAPEWVQATTAVVGTGNGSVCFNVQPNDLCGPRSAQLSIAGHSFLISQSSVATNATDSAIYSGLFSEGDANELSGYVSLKLSRGLKYSARLYLDGTKYSLKGTFDENGLAVGAIARAGKSPLSVQMQFSLCEALELTGSVSDGARNAPLTAHRSVFDKKINTAPLAGVFTFVVSPPAGDESGPNGYGYGSLKIQTDGKAKLAGSLADGSKIKHATTISGDGELPFYSALYRKAGMGAGWLELSGSPGQATADGQIYWNKPANPLDKFYVSGFTNLVNVNGSWFQPPTVPGQKVLNFANGTLELMGGDLPNALNLPVAMFESGELILSTPAIESFSLKVNPRSGLFKGTAGPPVGEKPVKLTGAVLQNLNAGYGYFLGTNQSSGVIFEP